MLQNSFRLFTVRGIEVGVHYSWLIIFALVTWSLSTYVFPGVPELRGIPDIQFWLLGALTAVLLFASVLIHELAHSFVALARGLKARSITLFIFGGVSNLAGEAPDAATEFVVAIVGPLTSFVLAGIAFAIATVASEPRVEVVASYLMLINFVLGVFNLVPGFPLDGGRVLRSILWKATGSLRKATVWAANVGKIVAYLMFGYAVVLVLNNQLIGGIYTGAIAWFLYSAAAMSVQQVVLESRLKRVKAGDIARQDTTAVAPEISVAELVGKYMLPEQRRAIPVESNGQIVGIVTITDVAKVPVEQRAQVTVGSVMGGRERLHTVRADSPVQDAIELMAEHDLEQVPVMDGNRLVGLLTRADVMRQLQMREALNV